MPVGGHIDLEKMQSASREKYKRLQLIQEERERLMAQVKCLTHEIKEVNGEIAKEQPEVIIEKINMEDILFFDGIYIPAVKRQFTKNGTLRPVEQVPKLPRLVLKNRPVKKERKAIVRVEPPYIPVEKKIIRRVPVLPEVEYEKPKPFTRPPAIYTNLPTPFGLATEMLREQLKKNG